MAKKKSTRKKSAKKKASKRSRKPKVDEADGVKVGEEPLPGMRLRCICRGHQGTIGRIAWSPCGRFIASPSEDKTVRIWDANDGKCRAVLEGHKGEANAASWSPDGCMLLSFGLGSHKFIWDCKDWTLSATLTSEMKYADGWSANGRAIIVSSDDRLQVWEISTRSVSQEYNASSEDIGIRAAWSPCDSAFAFAEQGGSDIQILGRSDPIRIESEQFYNEMCWSPDGKLLAFGAEHDFVVVNATSGDEVQTLVGATNTASAIAWSGRQDILATASHENTGIVRLWNLRDGRQNGSLEGHTTDVHRLEFSPDDQMLISTAKNETIVWHCDTWKMAGRLKYSTSRLSPSGYDLVTVHETDNVLLVWELCPSRFIRASLAETTVHYTSAKIVLVGESNVGKSCLAMRLAEDRYPVDHEHGTTHGMRFWPMEAEELHPAAKPPDGQRRDVVLWDFGGQDEYQLVHQMFLHDTTLALVLIDPTRGRAAMDEARDWNKRLEKHLGKDRAVKLLVGAKVDRKRDLIDQNSIDALCEECGFAAFLDLSAKTGRNTKRLRKLISDALDWDQMAKTSRPELFQHIRDDIENRRKKKQVVLTLEAFKKAIKKSAAKMFEEAAVDAVSDQLATQGIIVRTQLTGGEEALVLQLPVIERYAGSLIVLARNNGVPVIEERQLSNIKDVKLPGMLKKERLSPAKERIVLECIVELMIQHGICFRHAGMLVFPTLFPATESEDETLPHSVSLYYDFTGAIDNIYASLHGDVHEMRRKHVREWDKGGVHIIGAGAFGAPEEGRPESTPRLYNLIEFADNLSKVRVHTRKQKKQHGAWSGFNEWPDPDGGKGKVPYFDIKLEEQ